MKKLSKILIALGIGLVVSGLILWSSISPSPKPNTNPAQIDTSKFTDVVLINNSNLDSVLVYVTLQSQESIIGKFGMDSSNISNGSLDKGTFWAKRGVKYYLNDSTPVHGAIITFGHTNENCTGAQSDTMFKFGVNNFEFSTNLWVVNGKLTGKGESFDITCVDGLHSILKTSVTSFGPRKSWADSTHPKGLHHNYGAFWDYGFKDSTRTLLPFTSAQNGITFEGCINIAGVYPYGCDWGYITNFFPHPCRNPSYPINCSTKWGPINTSQTNRQGQGGQIICEFLGYTRDAKPNGK